ncbi:MAG: hypothetical protein ABFD20_08550 [Anaerolineales bacterium]
MAPIEVLFGALVLMFGLVGLVRGFLRELGVTMVMVFTLFFLNLVDELVAKGAARLAEAIGGQSSPEQVALYTCSVYLLVIIAVAFASYQGETLSFAGGVPRGALGVVLSLLTGLVNGYLIVGSLWYYMDKFDYPLKWLGFSTAQLSPLATKLLPLLPTAFLGQEWLLGQSTLLYLSIILLILRVVR